MISSKFSILEKLWEEQNESLQEQYGGEINRRDKEELDAFSLVVAMSLMNLWFDREVGKEYEIYIENHKHPYLPTYLPALSTEETKNQKRLCTSTTYYAIYPYVLTMK